MADIRQHAVFIGVVGGVGAAMVAWGPESPLAVGAVFLGLVVLHGTSLTVGRPAEPAERAPEPARARPVSAPASPASAGGSTVTPPSAPPAAEPRPRPAGATDRPAPDEADHAARSPRGNGREPADADDAERTPEESVWVRQQLTEDVDDIAFLPPYASGEAESAAEEAGPGARADWRQFLVDDPGEGFEEESRTTETSRNVPIPRHFALGTVAIIRGVLSPEEVAGVLLEQRRQPRKQFGEVAVAMGVLDAAQLRDLLIAQQEGLFTDEEIRDARRKLRDFRDRQRDDEV